MTRSLYVVPCYVFIFLTLLGSGCSGDMPKNQQVDYEADVKPLIEEANPTNKVRGSCNVIDSKSTCIDFIGSVFTQDRMKLSCAEGTFSLDACPYSDLGGCRATAGTISESIAWSYDYGGQPIEKEEVQYMMGACNNLQAGQWVTPADLLKNVGTIN